MSFVIAHLSDAHLSPAPFPPLGEFRLKRFLGFVNWKRGRERINDAPMLERLVADLRAHRPDHVAMTGDVVNLALQSEFRRAVEWLKTLGDRADVSFTPGNHDAYVRQATPFLHNSVAPWTTGDGAAENFRGHYPYLRVRGEVALIGLCSGVPTAPLLASGRLGKAQLAAFAKLLKSTGERGLARVVLIHHPPLAGGPARLLRGLDDAEAFEAVIADCGAEAILHGHTHRRMVHHLPSRATRLAGGRVPVIGVSSCSAGVTDAAHRAAYYLIRLERAGAHWRISARARGPLRGTEIGEQEPLEL
jgi:3',5'-cyclic AMP phosphodiesterase CpdA